MTIRLSPRSRQDLEWRLAATVELYPIARSELCNAREVVVFGSVARGSDGPGSDLDVLLVGNGRRLKTRDLDLVIASEECTEDRRWLGADLANHVARFGVWLKGKPSWTNAVFVSDLSKRKKLSRVLRRLSALYVNRAILSLRNSEYYLEKILLDAVRLEYLQQGLAIASTAELRSQIVDDGFSCVDRMPAILGAGPAEMVAEVAWCHAGIAARKFFSERFSHEWRRRLELEEAWRLAGRPAGKERISE